MKTLPVIGMIAAAITLTGCASMSVEPRDIPLESETKEFTFVKATPNGALVRESHIEQALAESMRASTGIIEAKPRGKNAQFDDIRGVEVEADDENIAVIYRYGEKSRGNNRLYTTNQIAMYNLDFQEQGDQILLTVATPEKARIVPGGVIGDWDPLLSDEDLKKDIAKINKNLKPKVEVEVMHEGEFNVDFDKEAVSANFSRLLDDYTGATHWLTRDEIKSTNAEKGKAFDLEPGRMQKPVLIKVYPYRDGAKVLYKFSLLTTVHGDGTVTTQDEKAAEYVQKLKDVAND
jgi:hypothetical protein